MATTPISEGNVIRARLARNSQKRMYRILSVSRSGVELAMVWNDADHQGSDFVQGRKETLSKSNIHDAELISA